MVRTTSGAPDGAAGARPSRPPAPGRTRTYAPATALEITRRPGELVATGWPVLVALPRKDVVGDVPDLSPDDRREGTLAATVRAVRTVAAVAGAALGPDPAGPGAGPGASAEIDRVEDPYGGLYVVSRWWIGEVGA
ncbi:MAG TPA: hypothetical protein VI248_23050 [Kineosporiaceae bacterium]